MKEYVSKSPAEVTVAGSVAETCVSTGMNHSRQGWFYTVLHSVSSEWGELTCCLKRSLKTYRRLAIINIYYLSKELYVKIFLKACELTDKTDKVSILIC